ncbi:MAG: hypothetical protein WCD16_04240 [Paracoccaceae bacterium]
MKRTTFPLTLSALAIGAAVMALPAVAAGNMNASGTGAKAQLDANGDGTVTLEEFLARPTARFEAMDSDGDGALSSDEIQAARAEGGRQARRGEGGNWGGRGDGDSWGDRNGWMNHHGMMGANGPEMWQRMYRDHMREYMPRDMHRYMPDEMGRYMGRQMPWDMGRNMPGFMRDHMGGGMPGFMDDRMQGRDRGEMRQNFAERMIRMFDQNDDGQLSAEELSTPPGTDRMFDRADTNGDGMISKDEFDAARQSIMGRGQGGVDTGRKN